MRWDPRCAQGGRPAAAEPPLAPRCPGEFESWPSACFLPADGNELNARQTAARPVPGSSARLEDRCAGPRRPVRLVPEGTWDSQVHRGVRRGACRRVRVHCRPVHSSSAARSHGFTCQRRLRTRTRLQRSENGVPCGVSPETGRNFTGRNGNSGPAARSRAAPGVWLIRAGGTLGAGLGFRGATQAPWE